MKKLFLAICFVSDMFAVNAQAPAYLNTSLSVEDRVNDLVSRMTVEEKAGQLLYTAPAITRLGVPEYNWWGEALHGVARAGYATVFPQSITIATVSYTHLRAHETDSYLVCRLLLEK